MDSVRKLRKRLRTAEEDCNNRVRMERERYEASIRQLKDIMKAQIERKLIANKKRDKMREGMEHIAWSLCCGPADELAKVHPDGLTVVEDEELAKWIIDHVNEELNELHHAVNYDRTTQEMYKKEKARADRLQKRVDELAKELAQARDDLKHEQTQASLARQALADAQRRLGMYAASADVQAPASDQDGQVEHIAAVFRNTLPAWIQDWQGKQYYDRDIELLRILATTGVPRRREAAEMFAQCQEIEATSGTMSRMFSRFERMGLIELAKTKSDTSGASRVKLIRLTTRGMDTARLLLGQDPVPSQLTELLARHKTPEHALLNLEAADLLREAGYTVDLFPAPIPVDGEKGEPQRQYAPDLAAMLNNHLLFIEAERGIGKAEKREAKWANCYAATGGEFYVVTATDGTMEKLKSEILFWLKQNGKDHQFHLWMTSISDVQGQGLWGADVWSLKRSIQY